MEILHCPNCSGEYLHQYQVDATWRRDENKGGTVYRSSKRMQSTEELKPSEIPHRRDNLVVKFFCEECDSRPQLMIYQHKGNTLTEWINE